MSVHGRLTIAKSILLAQYNYIGSVLDMFYPSDYKHIQNTLNHFVIHNELFSIDHKRNSWIPEDVLYGPKKLGGFAMIKIKDFFLSLKAGWIRRYVKGLDDSWADMLDSILELNNTSRGQLLNMASEHPKIKEVIKAKLPGISSFMEAHQTICKKFQSHKEKEDGRWLNSSIFHNPAFTWDKFTNSSKTGGKPLQPGKTR